MHLLMTVHLRPKKYDENNNFSVCMGPSAIFNQVQLNDQTLSSSSVGLLANRNCSIEQGELTDFAY